jgi:Flp pilus assembly pilin Flp
MLEYLMARIAALRSDEDGQTAVEYALVLILVALVLAAALGTGLTDALGNAITTITTGLGG